MAESGQAKKHPDESGQVVFCRGDGCREGLQNSCARVGSHGTVKLGRTLPCSYLQFIMNTDDGRYQVSMSIYPDKSASGNLNSSNINFAFTGRIVTH